MPTVKLVAILNGLFEKGIGKEIKIIKNQEVIAGETINNDLYTIYRVFHLMPWISRLVASNCELKNANERTSVVMKARNMTTIINYR